MIESYLMKLTGEFISTLDMMDERAWPRSGKSSAFSGPSSGVKTGCGAYKSDGVIEGFTGMC